MRRTPDPKLFVDEFDSIAGRARSGDVPWKDLVADIDRWMNEDVNLASTSIRVTRAYEEAFDRGVEAVCLMPDVDLWYVTKIFAGSRSCLNSIARNTMIPVWMDSGEYLEVFTHSISIAATEHWTYTPPEDPRTRGLSAESIALVLKTQSDVVKMFPGVGRDNLVSHWGISRALEQICEEGRHLEAARIVDYIAEAYPIPPEKRYYTMYHQVLYGTAP